MSDNSFLDEDEQSENNKKFKLSDLSSLLTLLSYGKGSKSFLVSSVFLILISGIAAVCSARILGLFVEKGVSAKNIDEAYFYGGILILLEIIAPFLLWRGRKILAEGSGVILLSIREKLYERLQLLPMNFFDRQPQGRIVTRLTHDVEGVEVFFSSSLGRLVGSIFLALLSIVAMCYTDLKLGLILVLGMIPSLLVVFLTRKKVQRVNREMSKNSSLLNSKLSEFFNGLRVIRSYGLENWTKGKYDDSIKVYTRSMLNANLLFSWSRPLISFMCSLPLILLIWFGGKEVLAGSMSVGLFVAFIRYCQKFYMPIIMIAREIHVVQQALTSTERVSSFFKHELEDSQLGKNGVNKIEQIDKFSGSLSFRDLAMYYANEEWVINGLGFDIPAGSSAAFVGRTGCGKTTVISLLTRLYDYQRGEILLDGVELKSFERESLRRNIGLVAQDPIIFKGSLRENLTISDSISDELILECCKQTGFDLVMNNIGISLDGDILDGGENLSVGERQLLSLTRVLLKNPKVLILDEATANIDPIYERMIQEAVTKVMKGRTCIIIAHRLDTIKGCDSIFVFDKGALIEQGNYSELMNKKGAYYSLSCASE